MPRPDPALLDPARYPFHCHVDPRFTDLDVNMHVNNVAMCGLLQEARIRFHSAVRYHSLVAVDTWMVASFSVEYLGEARHPRPIEFRAAAAAIGRTSHTVAQLALQDGRPVAYAQAVIVTIADGRPAPNPPSLREKLSNWMLAA